MSTASQPDPSQAQSLSGMLYLSLQWADGRWMRDRLWKCIFHSPSLALSIPFALHHFLSVPLCLHLSFSSSLSLSLSLSLPLSPSISLSYPSLCPCYPFPKMSTSLPKQLSLVLPYVINMLLTWHKHVTFHILVCCPFKKRQCALYGLPTCFILSSGFGLDSVD